MKAVLPMPLLVQREGDVSLSDDVREQVQQWAYIPMRGQAESLNVAIAAGVLMFSWLRATD